MRGYKGKHRRPEQRRKHIGAAAAAVGVAALGATQMPAAAQAAQVTPSHQAHPAALASYTVVSGDTLSQIAETHLGDASLWPRIARRNGLASTLIYPGQVLSLGESAQASLSHTSAAPASFHHATAPRVSFRPHYDLAASGEHAGAFSFSGLEHEWMAAGGSAATAPHAACIAEHESSGNAHAISPYNDYGLFQELNRPEALDPMKSAQIAVQMSHGGSNWSQWGTAGMC